MEKENYEFLEPEVNDEMNVNLENTLDLKEELLTVRERLTDTIIADKEDLYGQD